MNFYPSKAFVVPRQKNGLIAGDKKSLAAFWSEIDKIAGEDLSGAIGCYVFAVRAGKGVLETVLNFVFEA